MKPCIGTEPKIIDLNSNMELGSGNLWISVSWENSIKARPYFDVFKKEESAFPPRKYGTPCQKGVKGPSSAGASSFIVTETKIHPLGLEWVTALFAGKAQLSNRSAG